MRADLYNARELAAGRITPTHISRLTGAYQQANTLLVDGKLGPSTREAILAMGGLERAGGAEADDQDDGTMGAFYGPLGAVSGLPKNRSDLYRLFGDPGTKAKPSRRWKRENIVTHRDLPGIPHKWYFQCHKLAEPYMREGLRRAQVASDYVVTRAASFVLRHIQHNAAKPLSLHSWGIAIDLNPGQNFTKRVKRGAAPVPWSAEWLSIWPKGIDRPFVEAMESVGFTWGGVWGRSGGDLAARAAQARFLDPMHFELRVRQ